MSRFHLSAVTALALSDLELAGQIVEVGEQAGKFQKGDLRVVPLPSKIFAKGQPVYLYYEVYNLSRDAFGQTRYRVEYRLKGVQGSGPDSGIGTAVEPDSAGRWGADFL